MTKDKEILKLILKNQSILLQAVCIIVLSNTPGDNNVWFQSMKRQAEETEEMIRKINNK